MKLVCLFTIVFSPVFLFFLSKSFRKDGEIYWATVSFLLFCITLLSIIPVVLVYKKIP